MMRSWRSGAAACGVVLGWLVVMARLIQLQGTQRHEMAERVLRQSVFRESIPARPGDILDRHGTVLATTQEVDSLYAVPVEIEDPLSWAWQVAGILNLNADELYRRLLEHRERQFLWVQRRVGEEQSEQLRALGLKKGSWGLRREYLRQHLQSPSAAHVLGLRDIDNRGQGGLEEGLEEQLQGKPGERVMMRDARGMILEVDSDLSRPPVAGRSVISSLDLGVQRETERELDELMRQWQPRGACAIVMDPATGEVLAMASRPAFDPRQLVNVPEEAWKNLAVSAVFEPGSTFKPIIVAAALQQGLLQRDELIDCSYGLYRMGPRLLHDHHPYGMLSTADVLVKSSNIGMAKIGERLGLQGLHEAAVSFGFGAPTGIELPGELTGLLQPLHRWNVYSLGSIPMGQELACTPLQLITAHAVLANGGRLIRPTLICRSADGQTAAVDGEVVRPGEDVQTPLLNPEHARWLVEEPLRDVVLRGTGKAARIPGLSIFGKTGTAQKHDPVTGTYSNRAWVVSFVCGAPAEHPRVLVLVMVDEPTAPGIHYGGTVAAPVAARILQAALQQTTVSESVRTTAVPASSGVR
ncbi:MAG: peptidoglycan D,D-transpeptidase FtsI family protein [Planctomycetota bacterium]